jgi:hypothetical protein
MERPFVPGGGPYWATSAASIAAIARVDADVARRAFATGRGIALASRTGSGWQGAVAGRAWASLGAFESDLESRAIGPGVRIAMYDPERWRHTPIGEQQDPIRSIRRFVRLARGNGYLSMVTPHPRLVTVDGARCAMRAGETEEAAYVRSRITIEAAAADVVETQAQRSQRDPDAYRRFVALTAEQARRAKPDVVVLSGLSTSPGYPATPEMLFEAWESVRDVVDGHYISLSKGRHPEVMAAFLRMTLEPSA